MHLGLKKQQKEHAVSWQDTSTWPPSRSVLACTYKSVKRHLAHVRTCTCDVHDIGLASWTNEQRILSAGSCCHTLPSPKSVWLAADVCGPHAAVSTIGTHVCWLERHGRVPLAYNMVHTAAARAACMSQGVDAIRRFADGSLLIVAHLPHVICHLHITPARSCRNTMLNESVAHIHLPACRLPRRALSRYDRLEKSREKKRERTLLI